MVSSALVLPSVALALFLGPPARPPVQTPNVSPTQPQPGEPAIAPAAIEGEAAIAEPALTPEPIESLEPEPVEPEPEPEPGPGSDLPSWQADPSELPPDGEPRDDVHVDEWGTPIAPPPKRGPPKGGGFFAGAGVLFGAMITKQWITALVCDDVYCGWRGNADRALGLGVMGLSFGGGWFDGRRRAYWAVDADKPAKKLTGRRAAGWTMFALGLGGLIADAALYNACYQNADGPYTKITGFTYTCSPVASVVVVDLSTLIGAVGLGMGTSAESQRRHHKKYQLSLAPWGGRGQAGLSLSGRF